MSAKLSAKDFLRSLFVDGSRHSIKEILNGGMYKEATMRTAITDLKNPKYSGGPILTIKNDGVYFWVEIDPILKTDADTEEETDIVDSIPNEMPIAQGLANWVEDGAGLILGPFDASCDIDEEQIKLSVGIEITGTPSKFSKNGSKLEIAIGNDKANVSLTVENDDRFTRLFIESIEYGFAHTYSYPNIPIPLHRRSVAFEIANYVNHRSKLARLYLIANDDELVPCIKSSTVTSGAPETFEHICYSALETTYNNWTVLVLAANSEKTADEIIEHVFGG